MLLAYSFSVGIATYFYFALAFLAVAALAGYLIVIIFVLRNVSFTLGTVLIGVRAIAASTEPVDAVLGEIAGNVTGIVEALGGLLPPEQRRGSPPGPGMRRRVSSEGPTTSGEQELEAGGPDAADDLPVAGASRTPPARRRAKSGGLSEDEEQERRPVARTSVRPGRRPTMRTARARSASPPVSRAGAARRRSATGVLTRDEEEPQEAPVDDDIMAPEDELVAEEPEEETEDELVGQEDVEQEYDEPEDVEPPRPVGSTWRRAPVRGR